MFGLGPWELVVILLIVIIVFGVGKLPELGTGLGEGIRNFKRSYRELDAPGSGGKEGKPDSTDSTKEK